jgi:hypothetical protein
MSIEGGMSGAQKRFVCPHCGKVFFAWRPDTAPGAKMKCYFCKKEVEDEASKRTPPAPPPPRPATTPTPPAPAATTPQPAAAAPPPAPATQTTAAPAPAETGAPENKG